MCVRMFVCFGVCVEESALDFLRNRLSKVSLASQASVTSQHAMGIDLMPASDVSDTDGHHHSLQFGDTEGLTQQHFELLARSLEE